VVAEGAICKEALKNLGGLRADVSREVTVEENENHLERLAGGAGLK
jgi:hypothetical protein